MGFFKIRGALAIGGGSVQIGADVNLQRISANLLGTDDALQVGGTANLDGATRIGGAATLAGGFNSASGTPAVLPYATVSPTVSTNGQVGFVQKTDRSYLTFQCGGTPFHVQFPQTTHGTITVTVGGTP